jgi:multisubunit Na+/H+ antiporter MnhE subunit
MRFLAVPPLVFVYALTLASFALWDLAIGAVLATGLVVLFGIAPVGGPPLWKRLAYFVPMALTVAWEMLRGTWQVALVVLGIRPLTAPGIVAVPIGERSDTGVAVSGIATTLSPGTLLVDVDDEARTMLIHTMDASDPAKVIADHQRFYGRWQRHVFP